MNRDEKGLKELNIDDEGIIHRVVNGDVDAYEYLLKKYKKLVFNIVKKHMPHDLREELVHEVFVRAYQSLPSFKKKSSFKLWLSSIAVRTCYDFWRKRYRERELPMSSLSQRQQDWLETTIEDQSNQSFYEYGVIWDAREVLDWALDRLSAEERIVLEFVYLEGLSGKDTAKMLGWSVANVRIRAFRARRKLQKLLTNTTKEQSELIARFVQQAKEKTDEFQENYSLGHTNNPHKVLL